MALVRGIPLKKTLISGGSMKPNTDGKGQPDLSEMTQTETVKTVSFKTNDGDSITMTVDEFESAVLFFRLLLDTRNKNCTVLEIQEPEKTDQQTNDTEIEKKAG